MTKYGTPSGRCPKSVICTTFGCLTLAVAFASWMKRAASSVVLRELAAQYLHGEGSIEGRVTDLVDPPHPSFAENGDDLVAPVDPCADERIGARVEWRSLEPGAVERTERRVARKALLAGGAAFHLATDVDRLLNGGRRFHRRPNRPEA